MAHIHKTFRVFHVTKDEQRRIMEVMTEYSERIANGVAVSYSDFEKDIICIFGGNISAMKHKPSIDYRFCEHIAKTFMENGRWEEVFFALYGKFPVYVGTLRN